jgi:hypothetical protein
MSLADDFDKIGGPLQKPLVPKKPPPPPKAAPDATAVARNPYVPPADADAIEKRMRGEAQPEDAMTKFGDPKLQGVVGKPNTLEDDLAQATINLSKK